MQTAGRALQQRLLKRLELDELLDALDDEAVQHRLAFGVAQDRAKLRGHARIGLARRERGQGGAERGARGRRALDAAYVPQRLPSTAERRGAAR